MLSMALDLVFKLVSGKGVKRAEFGTVLKTVTEL